jgi:hypothetical protein
VCDFAKQQIFGDLPMTGRKRGRKSAAELAVATIAVARVPVPPCSLDDIESEIWLRTASAMPPDWLGGEVLELLVMYCRHAAAVRRLSGIIADLDGGVACAIAAGDEDRLAVTLSALKTLDRLLRMRTRESAAAAMLAIKLRIATSASVSRFRQKPVAPAGPPPWQK